MNKSLNSKAQSDFAKIDLVFWTIVIVLGATEFGNLVSQLRFLKYLPLAAALILLVKNNFTISTSRVKYFAPFLMIVLWSATKLLFGQPISIPELIFIISSFILFFFEFNLDLNYKLINQFLFAFFFLSVGLKIQIDFSLEALLASETSSGETNMLPFLFGFFTLFWVVKRNWLYVVVNIFFSILTFKRIAIVGIIIGLLYWILPSRFKNFINRIHLPIIINLTLLMFFFFVASGAFDEAVKELTGLSIGHFTQGRSTFFELVFSPLEEISLRVLSVGIGQGQLVELLFYQLGERQLFHNDLVKIFVENGLIVFLLFFSFFYRRKTHSQMLLALYLNVLFITDNTLIYTPVIFLFLLFTAEFDIQHTKNVR
ncbi:MAG: hypothetical protein HWE39_05205 [Oceanospirillaceae bacterium]|nr:hypothetical protein [Oceanospirillaceae bacterium]